MILAAIRHPRRVPRRSLLALALACAPATTPTAPVDPAPPTSPTPAPSDMAPKTTPPTPEPPVQPEGPAPLRPAAGLRLVFETHGWDLVATPGRVVVLDDDFLHLRGLDPATGAELWRVQVQQSASGRHTLYPLGERVLLHAGNTLVAVDPRDGRIVGSHPAGGYNGGDGSCRVEIAVGLRETPWRVHVPWDSKTTACAVDCECNVHLFQCDTGAPIGEGFRGSVTHLYHSLSEPHDNICWTPPALLGKVRGRNLLALERDDRQYEAAAIGDDGTVLWRKPALGDAVRRYREVDGDAASDRCWSVDSADLVAWTCSTGQVKWRHDYPDAADPVRARARQVGPDRLLVQRSDPRRNLVELHALADGRRLWQRSLAHDRIVLTPGEPESPPWDAPAVFIRLDLATGATLGELTVPARERLVLDPRGGYLRVGGPELGEYDPELRPLRVTARDTSYARWFSDRLIAVNERDALTVLRRPALDVALQAAGSFSVAESTPTLGPDALIVQEHRGERPLRFALLRADP